MYFVRVIVTVRNVVESRKKDFAIDLSPAKTSIVIKMFHRRTTVSTRQSDLMKNLCFFI